MNSDSPGWSLEDEEAPTGVSSRDAHPHLRVLQVDTIHGSSYTVPQVAGFDPSPYHTHARTWVHSPINAV